MDMRKKVGLWGSDWGLGVVSAQIRCLRGLRSESELVIHRGR